MAALSARLGAHSSGPDAHAGFVAAPVLNSLVHAVSEDGLTVSAVQVVSASTLHLTHHHLANLKFFVHLKPDSRFDFLPDVLSLSGFVCLLDLPFFESNSCEHLQVFFSLLLILLL